MAIAIMITDDRPSVGDANGKFIKDFDFEADGGIGSATVTANPDEAMRFESMAAALDFINTIPECKPVREDGKPNKPMMACSLSIGELV